MHIINTVIFDFGGVLIDWNPRHLYRRFFHAPAAMEAFLKEIDFPAWNVQQDCGRSFSVGVRELSARFPQYAGLIRAYHEHWEESLSGPIEGSLEILRRIKKAGYAVFGLSNWSMETFPRTLVKYGFFNLLDDYMISGEVGTAKPDPLIFRMALTRFHKQARECLFIDDSPANIASAASLGFSCIHFQSPPQLAAELERLEILGSIV